VLLVAPFADKQSGGDAAFQSVVVPDGFGQAFGLVGGQGVHRVEDDHLDPFAADMFMAVVEDREADSPTVTNGSFSDTYGPLKIPSSGWVMKL
jgi:hypothetical protein